MVTHRPNTLGAVDKLLVLKEGMSELFGPRNEIIAKLARATPEMLLAAEARKAASHGGAPIRIGQSNDV